MTAGSGDTVDRPLVFTCEHCGANAYEALLAGNKNLRFVCVNEEACEKRRAAAKSGGG
jgi:hypothetical protein